MVLWGLTIFIASTLVIVGLILLFLSHQTQQKKSKIILIIGCLIYASFMISFFKHKRYFTFSLLNSDSKNDIQLAFSQMPDYKYKYREIPDKIDCEDFYKQNYQYYPSFSSYRQKILFKSNANEGSSVFLYNLVKKLRKKNIPTLYAKLNYPHYLKTQDQLAKIFNLPTWDILKTSCLQYSEKGIKSYLVLDNPQNLILMIPTQQINKGKPQTILQNLIQQASLSVIMNTERTDNYQAIDSIIPLDQFQIKVWKGPTKAFINNILSSFSQEGHQISTKKLPLSFKTLAQLIKMPQQEAILKNSMGKNNFGDYSNANEIYAKVKQIEGGRVSEMLKNNIKLSEINELQRLGLISINQGIVSIK